VLSPPIVVPPLATPDWQKNPVFLRIKGITKDDLKNGTGVVEKLKYPPWDSRNSANKMVEKESGGSIGYGKYSHLSFKEVKEQDPRYFEYMIQNVPRFKTKAREFGLLD